jgi:hypothetical protein
LRQSAAGSKIAPRDAAHEPQCQAPPACRAAISSARFFSTIFTDQMDIS